jgi:hypothetical protein
VVERGAVIPCLADKCSNREKGTVSWLQRSISVELGEIDWQEFATERRKQVTAGGAEATDMNMQGGRVQGDRKDLVYVD